MKKKEVKRLLKQHPEFEQWLLQDSERVSIVRKNPAYAGELFASWNDRRRGRINFQGISQKTKRASEMLGNVQSIMEWMADYSKKKDE